MVDLDTARQILDRYNQAIIAKSADDLATLYAENAHHELPFAHSDAATLKGPEAIRETYGRAWAAAPVAVRSIVNVVLHGTLDGETFIAEEDIELTNTSNGHQFVASTVLVMRLAHGRIAHMRDYTDNLTIATALGRMPAIAG